MASNVGGQWVFALPANNIPTVSGFSSLSLSVNNGTSFFPPTVAGAFNLEVFIAQGGTTPPTPDTGFNAAAIDNGASTTINPGSLTGSTLVLGGGSYQVRDAAPAGATPPGSVILGSGAQTVFGASGDSMTGGSGAGVLVALGTAALPASNVFVVGGTGAFSVYGGSGDTIGGNPGATSTTGGLIISSGSTANTVAGGNETIVLPTAGNNTIFSGGGDTITGTASTAGGTNTVFGWNKDTINLTGDNGSVVVIGAGLVPIFSVPGSDAITGGTGAQSIFGATGDTLTGGQGGTEAIIGVSGSIVIGSGGNEVIGSGGGNTITALAGGGANPLIALGAKDTANFTGNSGSELIVGAASVAVTVGSGAVGALGAASEAFTLGAGADNITGSSVSGAGDTITSAAAINLTYNPGVATPGGAPVGGDLLNLAGSTGTAVINAFSNGTTLAGSQGTVNDTINAGNGADSVFGGGGDRIGIGNATAAGGSHLWLHSTSIAGAAIAFGTNDSVAGSGSKATVTVGSTVTGTTFAATDSLFYQNESTAATTTILGTAVTTGGNTTFTMPDGSTFTLIGVGAITAGMFK